MAVAVIILGRRIWGYCFSSQENVVSYVSDMMILIAITNLADGVLSVLNGTYLYIYILLYINNIIITFFN